MKQWGRLAVPSPKATTGRTSMEMFTASWDDGRQTLSSPVSRSTLSSTRLFRRQIILLGNRSSRTWLHLRTDWVPAAIHSNLGFTFQECSLC